MMNAEETIRQAETLNHIFNNMGYIPQKKRYMAVSEQQLDEIEKLLEDDLSEEELENLWFSVQNVQGVLSSFQTRLNGCRSDILERTQQ